MKHASALIYPETVPFLNFLAKLLIFFDSLSYYEPTESARTDNEESLFLANLCFPYVPAPLTADELFRFNRLLREMNTSRHDELSRLFSAAAAPLATGLARDPDETSSARVYSSLQQDAETKATIRYNERLWQARLVLKLAEILDKREAEVREGLTRVSFVEQKLYAALEGDNEPGSTELADIKGLDKLKHQLTEDIPSTGPSSLLITLRLKAWAELYLADISEQPPMILVTANQDYGAVILDGYENIRRRAPEKLFTLPLPVFHFTNKEDEEAKYLTDRKTFRKTTHETIEFLSNYLHETAGSSDSSKSGREKPALLIENLSRWEENLKHCFPASGNLYRQLDFYCFPGSSHTELFQRIFRLEAPVQKNRLNYPTGILAVLAS
jgi:hypothetical protein